MKNVCLSALLTVAIGCGASEPAAPPPPPPLEVTPVTYLADGSLEDINEESVVSLDPAIPPSMDFVLYITAKVKNLSTTPMAQGIITARLIDEKGNPMMSGTLPTAFVPATPLPPKTMMAPAGSVYIPGPLNITTVMGLSICPAAGGVDVQDTLAKLEMTVTDPATMRSTKVTRTVVPACLYSIGREQIRCHKACSL